MQTLVDNLNSIYLLSQTIVKCELALVLIQIQVALASLTFSIIAIITGSIRETYLGISFIDYYMNKRTQFSQKTVVSTCLGLSVLECGLYTIYWYGTMLIVFIVTVIAIIYSINNIYSAFKDKNKIEKEIRDYFYANLDDPKINNILIDDFYTNWKNIIVNQDENTYKEHYNIYKDILDKQDYNSIENLNKIQAVASNLVSCLLSSERSIIRVRGIKLLQSIYNFIFSKTTECHYEVDEHSRNPVLLAEVHNELIDAIKNADIDSLDGVLKPYILKYNVLLVIFRTQYLKDINIFYNHKVTYLYSIYRFLGYHVAFNWNQSKAVNDETWGEWLVFPNYTYTEGIDDDLKDTYCMVLINMHIAYLDGLTRKFGFQVIEAGLYKNGLQRALLDDYYTVLYYLTGHCYMYYLSGIDAVVKENVQTQAKNLLDKTISKNAYYKLISYLYENQKVVNRISGERIYEILRKYEWMPVDGTAKRMLMHDVAKDFYLFTILYAARYMMPKQNSDFLLRNIDDMSYSEYINNSAKDNVKAKIKNMLTLFTAEESCRVDGIAESMYDNFISFVKNEQKKRFLKAANDKNALLIKEKNILETQKSLETRFNNKLQIDFEKFSGIVENQEIHRFCVFDSKFRISEIRSDLLSSIINMWENVLVRQIVEHIVQNTEKLHQTQYSEYQDVAYIKILRDGSYDSYFGNQYMLTCKDYKYYASFERFVVKNVVAFVYSYDGDLLAIRNNALNISIENVIVQANTINIDESGAIRDGNMYKYVIENGLTNEFTEDELMTYLECNVRNIKIFVDIKYQINSPEDILHITK